METSLISVSQLGQAESLWQWAGGDHRYGKTWLEGAINILSELIFSEAVSQVIPEAVFFSSATTLQSPHAGQESGEAQTFKILHGSEIRVISPDAGQEIAEDSVIQKGCWCFQWPQESERRISGHKVS